MPSIPHPHRFILGYRHELASDRVLLVWENFESYPSQDGDHVGMGIFVRAFVKSDFAHLLSAASVLESLVSLSTLGIVLE